MLADVLHHVAVHDHLCMVYKDREEQFQAACRFMKIGLKRHEKCVCIVDDDSASGVMKRMNQSGINTDYAVKSGALSVMTKHEAYLRQGRFDPGLMISFIKDAVYASNAAGYKALRVVGDMSWALGAYPGTERLLEYEAEVDHLFHEHDILAVCQYDRQRFSPQLINNMLSIHPCCWL